jgi:hypothetical protein
MTNVIEGRDIATATHAASALLSGVRRDEPGRDRSHNRTKESLTMTTAATSNQGSGAATYGRRRFLRHYAEMVAAMFVGMAVLGGVVRVAVALTGLTYSTTDQPTLTALEMAFDMSVGMAVWMRYRGHGWASTLEMTGAMIAPVAALLPLLWLGLIDGDALMLVEHVVMLPLMYVVMLRRREEYGGHSHV